jgi:hypothetical protein
VTINTTQLCGGVNSSLSCNGETKQDDVYSAGCFSKLKSCFSTASAYKDITLTFVSGELIDACMSRDGTFLNMRKRLKVANEI